MSARYKLVRRPAMGKTDEKLPLYPRFAPDGTIRLEELVENAQGRGLSSAQMKAALQVLQDVIVDALRFGQNIELDGIGTFGMSLKARPVMDKKEIRAESVFFQDVTFRSSAKLRDRLKSLMLYRQDEEEVTGFTPEECEARTMKYLETHPYISGKIYRSLCRCGKTKAAADLKRMRMEGKLAIRHIGNSYLYVINDASRL